MPVPRHSAVVPNVQIPAAAGCGGVTELRVHGVGGSPPDAILGDLAPEQVSGDAIAGFYRSSDHRASAGDRDACLDVDRHVELYSWGGLTSRSKVRVLWLALLPFLFANLAGWMCSARTRESAWRFRVHRMAGGLGALALTVNAALIAEMISADVLGYQAGRAGLARGQWWLAPLGWHFVSGYPARQVALGTAVPVLFVLGLVGLASRSWRYEAVRPPYNVSAGRREQARKTTAAALGDGLADDEFWDGEGSVRLLTWVHAAVAGGFLAIALGVTAKALTGSPHAIALAWIAIGSGGATVAAGAAYVVLDALDTPPVRPPASATRTESTRTETRLTESRLSDTLRGQLRFLPVPAACALIVAGVFAWLQPAGPAVRAAALPGMAGVTGWTALAIAAVLAVALVSALLGLAGGADALAGGPWVTLMLGFAVLNSLMLGAEIWVAHLVGPVTGDATQVKGKVYVPYLITSLVPLVVWAAVVALLAFGTAEAVRWLRTRNLPADTVRKYTDAAARERDPLTGPLKYWYWSGLAPYPPPGDTTADPGASKGWERKIARAQFLGRAPHDAAWLLWGIILAQLAMALAVWRWHVQPPVIVRNLGVAIAGLALPALMAFVYSAWNDPARRRAIGVLWDVGTFWPRSYHPLSPPSYTERAVPELQRRMWWLHDNGGHVMLVAHSQGAVLATAALVQRGCRPDGDHPALITFGSPVCKLYSWGFPAYFGGALLQPLEPGGAARLRDWRNFHYPTDPIGGSVAPELRSGSDPVDQELLDPSGCCYVYGQPPPAARGHSGYWADPDVWSTINQVAAHLSAAPPGPDSAGVQVRRACQAVKTSVSAASAATPSSSTGAEALPSSSESTSGAANPT